MGDSYHVTPLSQAARSNREEVARLLEENAALHSRLAARNADAALGVPTFLMPGSGKDAGRQGTYLVLCTCAQRHVARFCVARPYVTSPWVAFLMSSNMEGTGEVAVHASQVYLPLPSVDTH